MAKKQDNLLRDAIADAKQVRETALANARLALEEAFTPHLTSMLATKLRNEVEDEDEEIYGEVADAPAAGDGHGSDEGGETDVDAVQQSSFKEAAEVSSDNSLDSSGIGDADPSHEYGTSKPKDPSARARSSSKIDNEPLHTVNEADGDDDEELPDDLDAAPEAGVDTGADVGAGAPAEEPPVDADLEGGDEEEDLDLEAVIKELEADIVSGDEEEEEELPVAEDDDLAALDTDDREMADMEDEPVTEGEEPTAADGHGSAEGGETDREAVEKSTFKEAAEDNFGGKKAPPFGGGDDEEEIDLEEILREIEDEEKEDEMEVEAKGLKAELKEYRRAVGFLRSKLNEVNLLNAKLLYTNRLFRDYNMDVRTKMRVVENFDRATTVREAKLVYATIAESFRGKGTVSRKVRTSITEGMASRKSGSTASRQRVLRDGESLPTVLREGVELAARFKKLAGIKG